jgi:CRISPR/Cas system-associated exonuclease Cas4 (RecB family)
MSLGNATLNLPLQPNMEHLQLSAYLICHKILVLMMKRKVEETQEAKMPTGQCGPAPHGQQAKERLLDGKFNNNNNNSLLSKGGV